MIASLYVFFLLFYVSHLGVYRVCLSTAITDNPNSVLPRNCIFLYFLLLFFRLKFSKTPFHVVLSKNKTNTKKKYHFSLLISVSFHSSQFFFSALNLYTSEPLSRQKLTALVYVFVIFWVAFTFFHSFFLDFFLYFVTKIYFSARARVLHYDPFACITFIPTACVCVSIVSLNSIARAHTHIPIIMTGFLFALLNQCFNLSHSKFYLETSSSSCCLYDYDHARTHTFTHTRRTACLGTILSQKLEITCSRRHTHAHARTTRLYKVCKKKQYVGIRILLL